MLKSLEDDLLYRLANSTGNLLDDVELIEVLQKSKLTSVEVNEKLTIAFDTDIRINTAREEYRPAARRGALTRGDLFSRLGPAVARRGRRSGGA